MNFQYTNNRIIFADCDSFDIEQTLECGQCFRFTRLFEKEYRVVAFSKTVHIKQEAGITEFYPCTLDEFKKVWIPYFDLARDYSVIKTVLSSDPVMAHAIEFAGGIRILNQDPWECLLSFILSQNMNIPRIKKLIGTLSERYGNCMNGFHTFPSVEQMSPVGMQELIDCKTGFRAKYLFDAINKIALGEINLSAIATLPTGKLKETLRSIYGVGDKVADCVLLFSFGRHEVFPMDVWIKRALQKLYFDDREVRPKDAYAFAQEKFGAYAGVAQQYLFYYMRETYKKH